MKLSPRYERYAERLEELVEEGKQVARLDRTDPNSGISQIWDEDKASLYSWLTKSKNIIRAAFGTSGTHYEQIEELAEGTVSNDYEVYRIVGVLEGALDDLRNGFLVGQEFLVAGEVFDSVLEQARHLSDSGHENPAAVLGRVVIEDALERLAREGDIKPDQKASRLNDELRKEERYGKPQWRRIQAWLDIGNAAAHGNFDEYSPEEVAQMLDEIERFLANQLHT